MRSLLILCLAFICYKSQAQTTFLKQHGFQVALYIYPTQFTFATDSNYYAVWSLQDHVGGQLSTARRFAFASYDLQGNYLNHFYIADDVLFKELTNVEIIGDSTLIISIFSQTNARLERYKLNGDKIWSSNANIFDFKIKNETIYGLSSTINSAQSQFYYGRINLNNGAFFDSILIDTIINQHFSNQIQYSIRELDFLGDLFCFKIINTINQDESLLIVDSSNTIVYIFDIEEYVPIIKTVGNKIFYFSSIESKIVIIDNLFNISKITPFSTSMQYTLLWLSCIQNGNKLINVFNYYSSSNKFSEVQLSDSSGNLISLFRVNDTQPQTNINNLISTASGFFFQSSVGGGNSYYAYICAVDSCFNTSSSDFTVNLQNPDCFAPTSIYENVILENTLSLFPNPTASHFTIQSRSAIKSLTVYNLQGQQVLQKSNLNATSCTVEEQLPSGVYVVKVETEEGVEVRKVLVGSDNGQ